MTTLGSAILRPGLSRPRVPRSSLVPVSTFLLCLFWRSPGLLLHPRFWAEEGHLYYDHMRRVGLHGAFVTVINGNYQILPNLVTEAAARSPDRFAAHVTTYLSLVVVAGCCWLLADLMLSRGCSLLATCVGAAIFALQPGGYEVFLNATNLQWVTSLVGLLLCLSRATPAWSSRAIGTYLALAVCGLNGTTTCILLPVFVLAALRDRSGFRWGMALVLAACTAIQAVIVVAHHGDIHRPFALDAFAPLAAAFQVVFAVFLPAHLLDVLGPEMRDATAAGHAMDVQLVLLAVAVFGLLALAASRRLGRDTVGLMVVAVVVSTAINCFGAISTADTMLSGWAGARYFFVGASCTAILVAPCMDAVSIERRSVAAAVAVLALSNGALTGAYGTWTAMYLQGPSFGEELDACPPEADCVVDSWPPNAGFTLEMKRGSDRR